MRKLRKNDVQVKGLILCELKHLVTARVWIVVKEAMTHFKSSVNCFGWEHASGRLKTIQVCLESKQCSMLIWKEAFILCSIRENLTKH